MAPPFKILIAGAGLGGVTLAVLLERAKIDFELFESSSSVSPLGTPHVYLFHFYQYVSIETPYSSLFTNRPKTPLWPFFHSVRLLGSAILIGPTVMPLFEQLGLLRRLQEVSKPIKTMHLTEESLKRIGEIDLADHKEQ